MGKAFYKGGFEGKMNRREAALILETPYVLTVSASTLLGKGRRVWWTGGWVGRR